MCKYSSVFGGERGGHNCKGEEVERMFRRRSALAFLLASPTLSVAFSANGKTKSMNPYDERRLLEQNKKIQAANRAPDDFPNFIREGEQVYQLWAMDSAVAVYYVVSMLFITLFN